MLRIQNVHRKYAKIDLVVEDVKSVRRNRMKENKKEETTERSVCVDRGAYVGLTQYYYAE